MSTFDTDAARSAARAVLFAHRHVHAPAVLNGGCATTIGCHGCDTWYDEADYYDHLADLTTTAIRTSQETT